MHNQGWIRALLAVVSGVLLAACSSDTATTSTPVPSPRPAGQPPGFSITLPADLPTDLRGTTITAVLGSNDSGKPFEAAAIQKFTNATGIQVRAIAGPDSSTERLAQYLKQLGAGSSDVDVYMIDVIWPGIMAPYAADLASTSRARIASHVPAIVRNNTVNNKLVAVPWYTDVGLLYYRTDLLQKYGYAGPPQTWAELQIMAERIQDGERATNNDFWGFIWQGKSYEGLTCDALEWQLSNGGGSIIEPDGTVSLNNPQTVAAFNRARNWIGVISPEGVTSFGEPETLSMWTAGNAAFMRNWPGAYAASNAGDSAVRGKIAVTLLPQGDGTNARHASTLGGWQLMVSAYSKHQAAAIAFVQYMTSPELQRAQAIERTLLPTIGALYDDPAVLRANPYYKDLKPVLLGGAVPRPSTIAGDRYNAVSTAYFTGVSQIINGQRDATIAVAEIEQKLKDIMASKQSGS